MVDCYAQVIIEKMKAQLKDIKFDNTLFTENDFYDKAIDVVEALEKETGVSNYKFANGASKGVIWDKRSDYVVKIPINGSYGDYAYSESGAYLGYDNDMEKWYGGGFDNGWDYCLTESYLYADACEWGLTAAFAGTVKINDNIYVQEKATIFSEILEKRRIESKLERSCNGYADYIHSLIRQSGTYLSTDQLAEIWMLDFIDYHGEEKFLEFLEFINENCINDLHWGNIGYIEDRPVLVDYSGFDY